MAPEIFSKLSRFQKTIFTLSHYEKKTRRENVRRSINSNEIYSVLPAHNSVEKLRKRARGKSDENMKIRKEEKTIFIVLIPSVSLLYESIE